MFFFFQTCLTYHTVRANAGLAKQPSASDRIWLNKHRTYFLPTLATILAELVRWCWLWAPLKI